MNVIDAYCHIGIPRFGTATQALNTLRGIGVEKAVLVLGPKVPDLSSMYAAMDIYGNDIRTVGIPFGDDIEQNRDLASTQLDAGAVGMRLTPEELRQFPFLLDMIGNLGRWIYAIGVQQDLETLQTCLTFLETYPQAKIAAPHFLSSSPMAQDDVRFSHFCDLLQHPRFYAIFSRHGGVGSSRPYPHEDLKPWAEQVIGLCGEDRIMWGSEFPVFFWRNENPEACRDWLKDLLPNFSGLTPYHHDNAYRALFSEEQQKAVRRQIPGWLDEAIDRSLPVGLLQKDGIEMPMDAYYPLLSDYLESRNTAPDLDFAAYIARILADVSTNIRLKSDTT